MSIVALTSNNLESQEYHKNPSTIGSRAYSPFARWKFREFNELPHLFQKRLNQSYLIANRYIDQFPKTKTVLLARYRGFRFRSFCLSDHHYIFLKSINLCQHAVVTDLHRLSVVLLPLFLLL